MHIVSKPSNGFRTPYAFAIYFLSGKWQIRILDELMRRDALTLDELKEKLCPITDTALTIVLQELLDEKCIIRTRRFSDAQTVYLLTEKSRELMSVVADLERWSREFADDTCREGAAAKGEMTVRT